MHVLQRLTKPREEENYYSVLGCFPSSTKEQIATEYRRKCLEYHPDKNLQNSTEMFIKISRAYDVLSNDEERRKYGTIFVEQLIFFWDSFFESKSDCSFLTKKK